MRIPLLKTLALAGTLGLTAQVADAQTPTVLFDFEGAGGDTQGWQPDIAPDENLGEGARSLVRTIDSKPVGMGMTIDAFEGTWMLEAVPNRPLPAAQFRGMKYEWSTPQDWTTTPVLRIASSMYGNGPNAILQQFRIRVTAQGGAQAEMIYDGDARLGRGGDVQGDTFINEFQVLTLDLTDFAGLSQIVRIEAAGRHVDTEETGGTPVTATQDDNGDYTPIEGVNWGGLVQIDEVTVSARPVSNEDVQPGLRSLSNAYPNPAAGVSTLDLAVDAPQRVTARVVDVLGRTVQTAFDGSATPGAPVAIRVPVGSLASGTYVVVVEGETFRQSRLLTVR